MATIKNTYTGNGSTVIYSLTFPYLRQEHVKVTINGTPTTAFSFVNSSTIQFVTAPANGDTIVIFRETDSDDLDNRFFPNSSIRAGSLNSNFTQGLYVAQETQDEAGTATTTANLAISTANGAVSTANSAVSAANGAVSTANAASSAASSAVSTANAASSAASSAVSTANSAVSTANAAVSTANAAQAAVAAVTVGTPVADLAALLALSPSDGDFFTLIDSTGVESSASITNVPGGFVGSNALEVTVTYISATSKFDYVSYRTKDPETRYALKSSETNERIPVDGSVTNDKVATNAAIAYSKLASMTSGSVLLGNGSGVATPTAVSGDVSISNTGVTSIGSGVIVNADVSATAGIAGTKISPDFGSQNVQTSGQFIGALNGNASTATQLQTARTINGVSFNGTSNITITANTPNSLTPGSFITGSSFDGSTARTWDIDATSSALPSTVVSRDVNSVSAFQAVVLEGTFDTPLIFFNSTAATDIKSALMGVAGSGSYVIRSQDDIGGFISTDLEITRNASGATSHLWYLQGSQVAQVTSSGFFFNTTTASPGAGNTTVGAQIRQDGRLCVSTDGSNAHSFNRNGISRSGQVFIQARYNGSSVLDFQDWNTGDGVAVNSTDGNLYLEGPQVRSETIRDDTTASASNVFINTTTGRLLRSTSSIKYKKDVEDIDPAFSQKILDESRPVWFRSKATESEPTHSHWGLIAEEVAEYDPRLVHFAKNEDGTLEPEGVQYERIIPHLLVILKQQQSDIAALKAQVESLTQSQPIQ